MSIYTGGKNSEGIYQRLINLMPPHRVYIELYLGSGAILRHKRPAETNIGVEIDLEVIERFTYPRGCKINNLNAIEFLQRHSRNPGFDRNTLIYADPPYVRSTRADQTRDYYRYEMSDQDHACLLEALLDSTNFGAKVMISGYRCDLYDRALSHWRRVDYPVQLRGGGKAVESVWCSFKEPFELHDYSYLGENYRERQDIKRQQQRWRARLEQLPPQKRYALLSVINEKI